MIALPRLEGGIISALLRDNAALLTCQVWHITPESFSDPVLARLYAYIADQLAGGKAADMVTVCEAMPEMADTIAGLEFAIATAVNLGDWCRRVKEAEAARLLAGAAAHLGDTLKSPADLPEAMRAVGEGLEKAIECARGRKIPDTAEAAAIAEQRIWEKPEPPVPLFPANTEASRTAWVRRGDLMTLAAKSGTGKTALCAGWVWEQLQQGFRVLYICTESSTVDILARIAAAASDTPHYAVRAAPDGGLGFRSALADLRGKFRNSLKVVGNDAGIFTPGIIRQYLRAFPAQVLYVDFVQNLHPDRRRRDRLEEKDDIIQSLHDIVGEYHLAGIIVSQFNRASMQQGGKPDLTWIKDTTMIEQLSAQVAFLWRSQEGDKSSQFYAKKNRNGPLYSWLLSWWNAKYVSSVMPFSGQEGGDHGDTH